MGEEKSKFIADSGETKKPIEKERDGRGKDEETLRRTPGIEKILAPMAEKGKPAGYIIVRKDGAKLFYTPDQRKLGHAGWQWEACIDRAEQFQKGIIPDDCRYEPLTQEAAAIDSRTESLSPREQMYKKILAYAESGISYYNQASESSDPAVISLFLERGDRELTNTALQSRGVPKGENKEIDEVIEKLQLAANRAYGANKEY